MKFEPVGECASGIKGDCIVSKEGIRVDYSKIQAIQEWPIPMNVQQVRQSLGSVSYYRVFFENFSDLAEPYTIIGQTMICQPKPMFPIKELNTILRNCGSHRRPIMTFSK